LSCVLIAGGGTGGHIYPAIAIAQVIKKRNPDCKIEFIGSKSGLEVKIIPREGYSLHLLKIGALNQVSLLTKIKTLFLLPIAIIQAMFVILKVKPDVVLGVGGYASGPAMLAASFLGTPTYLFEPNAHPGLTNRWLAGRVKKAFINFEVSKRYFKKWELVGIPVREGLDSKVENGRSTRGDFFNVLVFGGSQGARAINNTVLDAVKIGDWMDGIKIVHQIGHTDFQKISEEYKKIHPLGVNWFEFLYDMPEQYAKADLVICRAGASTLAELAALRKAAVLIPLPTASDDHQGANAEALGSKNAAHVILQKDFTTQNLISTIINFKKDPSLIENLEKNISAFDREAAADKIANQLENYFESR
jgi:UDP-N-acetylglucosamine--N-acetylmuramyl-(pentapeptide) pyrophosphoryl-undecaprenol N-acetylglucosamine transferase